MAVSVVIAEGTSRSDPGDQAILQFLNRRHLCYGISRALMPKAQARGRSLLPEPNQELPAALGGRLWKVVVEILQHQGIASLLQILESQRRGPEHALQGSKLLHLHTAFLRLPATGQSDGQIVVSRSVVRLQGEDLSEVADGFLVTAGAGTQQSQVVLGGRVLRVLPGDLSESLRCLRGLILVPIDETHHVVGLDLLGVQSQGPLKGSARFLVELLIEQCNPQVHVAGHEIRVQFQKPGKFVAGGLVVELLHEGHAPAVETQEFRHLRRIAPGGQPEQGPKDDAGEERSQKQTNHGSGPPLEGKDVLLETVSKPEGAE